MVHNKKHQLVKKVGLLPGSLIYTGHKSGEEGFVQQIVYNENEIQINKKSSVNQLFESLDKKQVNWIHFDALNDIESIQQIGKYFDIHELMLEDTLNVEHFPKVDFSEKHVFLTLKRLIINNENQVEQEHISFILGDYYLISLFEQKNEIYEIVKERIEKGIGKLRNKRADYLFYILLDVIVDQYFIVLENIGKSIEDTEDLLIENPTENYINKIHYIKKQLLFIRKYIIALREAILNIIGEEPDQIFESNYKYLHDVKDHINHIFETVELYREDQKTLLELNSSNMSNKLNQVMKTLTIVATIFIPLTFVAGIYGMNFKNMPELGWRFGYYAVLLIMAAIATFMVWFMKKRKWF